MLPEVVHERKEPAGLPPSSPVPLQKANLDGLAKIRVRLLHKMNINKLILESVTLC